MKTFRHNQRGSILIVAMIFSAIIAICLTSYLQMARTAMTVSQRAFFANNTMNLTETGLELAINAINTNSWGAWTISGANATATFTGFTFDQGATGTVEVYVQNYNTSAPFLVAKGIIRAPRSAPIVKMVEVTGTVNRSLFGKGLVGKDGVSFSGNNASVDAWSSNPTNAATGTYVSVPYSNAVASAQGSIAAVAISADVSVNNADIWGSASVGSTTTGNISVGPNGRVGPYGTASGTLDPNSIASNFTANLPNASNPTPTTITTIAAISGATTLPGGSDVANASDGKYYYRVPSISESGSSSNVLTIAAGKSVVFIVTASTGTGVSVSGNGGISVSAAASMAIYTASDVSIAGNGVLNGGATALTANPPSSVAIYGTATAIGQSIGIAGNGVLSALVYAPNAAVKVNGNGDVLGAFVGDTVNLVGNAGFHYDLSLANMNGNPLFQPSKWVELVSASDRATYATQLP